MKCDEVIELMQRHLDGDLDNAEQKQLTDHLEACPECADMMERLLRIDQDLASLPKVMPAYSLVDSILPKLTQLDVANVEGAGGPFGRLDAAASEMHLVSRIPPQSGELGRSQRPWYSRGKLARVGGLAAAAVMLGVMIVNGLPERLEQTSQHATESTAASEEMSILSAEPAAGDRVATDAAAPEQPAAVEPMAKAESVSSGGSQSSEGAAADTPKEAVPTEGEMKKAEAGDDVGVSGAENRVEPGEDASAPAPAPEAAPEEPGAEPAPAEVEGLAVDQYGIFHFGVDTGGEGEDEPVHSMKVAPEEPAYAASLPYEEGGQIAHVQQLPDGAYTVVVMNEAGETIFASNQIWEAGTEIQLMSWNGDVVTYTVKTEAGVQSTYEIDAAALTERSIEQ